MNAEVFLKDGNLQATREALQGSVRAAPSDPQLRVFLFQVLVLLGGWERAVKQLQVAATLDPAAVPMAQAYRELIRCELQRADVIAGRRAPLLLGEPEPWQAMLLQALAHTARGEHEAAEAQRTQALERAPATAGVVDGRPFEWIADCDSRLGPILEVVVRGRYCWLPFHLLRRLEIARPVDLRDLVWLPAKLDFASGEQTDCFIPTRYPGSEGSSDDAARLCRKTTWLLLGEATSCGTGQRMLVTDRDELSLLDIRSVEFATSESAATSAETAVHLEASERG